MKKLIIFILVFNYAYVLIAQKPGLGVTINGGKKLTNNSMVTLAISGLYATNMKISNDASFTNAQWVPISTSSTWKLTESDGLKEVFVKFKDKAGNESSAVSSSIELDKTAPKNGKITINKDAELTNKPQVQLEISAEDADLMMVSNLSNFAGALWTPFSQTLPWTLEGLDGLKIVYIKFKDKAENISEVVNTKITLDKTPPKGTVAIQGNPKWVKSPKITLELNCPDADQMMISTIGKEWIPYEKTKEITLPEGDGHKVIYAIFMDKAHNSSATLKTEVNLKTNPPTDAKIMLDKGHKFTINKDKKIVVQLHAIGAKMMMLSNKPDFSDGATWKPFLAAIPIWVLDGEDGEKTVYAKFKDEAENESEIASAKIMLDRTPPTNTTISINNGAKGTNNTHVKVQLKATEAVGMQISTFSTFAGAPWENYSEEKQFTLVGQDGVKLIYARFRDEAGNFSTPIQASIKLDRTPPIGNTIIINNNEEWANNPNVTLTIASRDAHEMLISDNPSFEGANWEPFSTTKNFKLSGDDGIKAVGAKFRDEAGNVSAPISDNIKLSTKPPSDLKLIINDGQEFTTKKDMRVTLKLQAKNAAKMMIANSSDFDKATWLPYTSVRPLWALTPGDGEKIIYAKFMSGSGTVSEVTSSKIILDINPPSKLAFKINDGAKGTNNKEGKVKLTISAEDATEMKITDGPTFDGKNWEPYKTSKEWTLTGADGPKSLKAIFKDKAGNISATAGASIFLDRNPPAGTIEINKNLKFTTNRNVKLQIKVTEATEMTISNSSSFGSEWIPVAPKIAWELTEGDGLKAVYIKFKDAAGNISEVATNGIELDSKPPAEGTISINNNAEYCTDKTGKVMLQIKSDGAFQMKISNRSDFQGSTWITYSEAKEWLLLPGENERKVNIKFKDEAGNETTPISAIITVDFSPPTAGTLTIDKGKQFSKAKDRMVELEITSEGADEMMISNDANFSDGTWEPYAKQKNWKLTDGEGLKTVHIKFRDKANNISTPIKAQITSDTEF